MDFAKSVSDFKKVQAKHFSKKDNLNKEKLNLISIVLGHFKGISLHVTNFRKYIKGVVLAHRCTNRTLVLKGARIMCVFHALFMFVFQRSI